VAAETVKPFLFTGTIYDARLAPFLLEAAEMRGGQMAVLPDHWIRKMAKHHGMIEPFAESRSRKGRISFGPSSYGYDFRLAGEFRIPDFEGVAYLDPKDMSQLRFHDYEGTSCLIPARSFILGRSLEYFRIPRDVLVVCQGKSTYARCGIVVNVTPLEPEWEGFITISLINAAPVPVRIHAGEGIGQMIVLRAEDACRVSYADRKGKYQAQKKIQPSKV
jgi:dCTP deaminase